MSNAKEFPATDQGQNSSGKSDSDQKTYEEEIECKSGTLSLNSKVVYLKDVKRSGSVLLRPNDVII